MAMGKNGTVNISVKMMTDIINAVEEYKKITSTLYTNLDNEITGLVGNGFAGAAANGFNTFYTTNIKPVTGDGLTKLLKAIDDIATATKNALPGKNGLDDQLGEGNSKSASKSESQ